ncbi:hypothetical protein C9J27_04945 [Photobacterium kishitanii]|uniref:Uncharacterized protein n=2 Tax=Photobacterium kishitanii TaxID=318456 RepID=A0A2T3KLE9_9GAMM|nr:hypothetical protein C9J27_04945 [Photobacterium kishitanii]
MLALISLISGCASNNLSVKTDPYSGDKVVSSNFFYSLTPFNKWREIDRIVFKYDYIGKSNMFVLRAGYLTGAGAYTGLREGIVNVDRLGFMIDGKEQTFQPATTTNYDGVNACNEIGICAPADGSYSSFAIPISLLSEIEKAQTVKVKLLLGNHQKVAILKSGDDLSDAYDMLVKFDSTITKM